MTNIDKLFINNKDKALEIRALIRNNMDNIEDILNLELKQLLLEELTEEEYSATWLQYAREIFFAG